MKQYENFESDVIIGPVSEKDLNTFKDNTETNESDYDLLHSIFNVKNLLGAYINNHLIGVLAYNIVSTGVKIEIIIIDPHKRGLGVGRNFIEYLIKNFDGEYITSNPYTLESEQFFIKMGFNVDTEFDPNDTNTVVLRK